MFLSGSLFKDSVGFDLLLLALDDFINWACLPLVHRFYLLCQEDEYLLELVRYIHLNPVRSGMAKSLGRPVPVV
ncbi:MAG: hypothetical protein J7K15_14130 [Deltaproteobacteria bacterium]|nr:hypothetical protein [Deltaproteobacteria bacterium]